MVLAREEEQVETTRCGETEAGLQRGAQCTSGRARVPTLDQSAIVTRNRDSKDREILLVWPMVSASGGSSSSAQRSTGLARQERDARSMDRIRENSSGTSVELHRVQ